MSRISGVEMDDVEPVRETMNSCFPDVEKGDQITGLSRGPDSADFYVNGQLACQVEWPQFRESFFGIWLGDQSRAPKKQKRLLGEK